MDPGPVVGDVIPECPEPKQLLEYGQTIKHWVLWGDGGNVDKKAGAPEEKSLPLGFGLLFSFIVVSECVCFIWFFPRYGGFDSRE